MEDLGRNFAQLKLSGGWTEMNFITDLYVDYTQVTAENYHVARTVLRYNLMRTAHSLFPYPVVRQKKCF